MRVALFAFVLLALPLVFRVKVHVPRLSVPWWNVAETGIGFGTGYSCVGL